MRKNMELPNDFAIFILTNGRPDNIKTLNALDKSGYTGKLYIVCDNEDSKLDEYIKKYGEKVIIFDKQKEFDEVDNADLFTDKKAILYARNASFKIAKEIGIKYFMMLDDDYTRFMFRFNEKNEYITRNLTIKNLDAVIKAMLDFYIETPNITTLAMMQGGDFIGGYQNPCAKKKTLKRKAMNSFICSVERPFKFTGRANEDVTTYCTLGMRGKLFLSVPQVYLCQLPTQSLKGGMSEVYKKYGTYMKSFYSILSCPAFIKLQLIGNEHSKNPKRIHHKIIWENAVPKIISEEYKKK